MKLSKKLLGALLRLAILPFPAFAAVDSGDTAWMLVATALVLLASKAVNSAGADGFLNGGARYAASRE